MVPYLGDFKEDDTVLIVFNTFTSDDPSASCTITNFVNTDIHIHKEDDLTQRNNAAGITVSVDFDGITGSHMIKIDTSDDTVAAFWVVAKDYFVRIEGTTIDGATINVFVGHFSIENRFNEVDVTHILGHLLTQTGTQLADGFQTFFDTANPTTMLAINLPNQTMDITGDITGNLSGTVGTVNALAANVITAASINADAITEAKIADNAIAAEHIAAAAIDNATFAADVGSTAHGTNIIALAVRKILEELNLDHLLKVTTGVAADGDLEAFAVAGTVIAHMLSTSADATLYKASTDSMQGQRDENSPIVADLTDGGRLDLLIDAIKAVTDALTAAAATKLALSAGTMVTGTVSWENTNATTTVFYSDDIVEATADHYKDRLVFFTSGVLVGQHSDITAYALDTGEGKFTVTALTEAPADNVTFIIV